MVATDSYRLSVKETALGESAPELEAIIPARALTELSGLPAATRSSSACTRTTSSSAQATPG